MQQQQKIDDFAEYDSDFELECEELESKLDELSQVLGTTGKSLGKVKKLMRTQLEQLGGKEGFEREQAAESKSPIFFKYFTSKMWVSYFEGIIQHFGVIEAKLKHQVRTQAIERGEDGHFSAFFDTVDGVVKTCNDGLHKLFQMIQAPARWFVRKGVELWEFVTKHRQQVGSAVVGGAIGGFLIHVIGLKVGAGIGLAMAGGVVAGAALAVGAVYALKWIYSNYINTTQSLQDQIKAQETQIEQLKATVNKIEISRLGVAQITEMRSSMLAQMEICEATIDGRPQELKHVDLSKSLSALVA